MRSMTRSIVIAVALASGAAPVQAGEPSSEARTPQGRNMIFQLGVDALGGGLADVSFVGGVNASILYPALSRLWVGLRPSLHLVVMEDSEYHVTWFHPDLAVHVNLMHAPVRLYLLGAAGYALALDTDLYRGVAHGWSASSGVGVAWRPDGPLGLFVELAFRGGSAARDQRVLDRDASGNPVCDDDCQVWRTRESSRELDLLAISVNLGLVYAP